MKELLKRLLFIIGYRIERYNNTNIFKEKHLELIEECYGVCKSVFLKDLPEIDKKTAELIQQLDGTQVSEAFYIINSIHSTISLEGDICEFGVAQGYTSALMAHSIRNSDKKVWLFDSFEGLPSPTEKDLLKDDIFKLGSMEAYKGTMAHKVDSVIKQLNKISFDQSRVEIKPGFIEKTIISEKIPNTVSFAYIDFDFYKPISIALNFLDGVISKGGMIIVDDYDFFSSGSKTAVDEFHERNKKNYHLEIPSQSVGYFCLLKRK